MWNALRDDGKPRAALASTWSVLPRIRYAKDKLDERRTVIVLVSVLGQAMECDKAGIVGHCAITSNQCSVSRGWGRRGPTSSEALLQRKQDHCRATR